MTQPDTEHRNPSDIVASPDPQPAPKPTEDEEVTTTRRWQTAAVVLLAINAPILVAGLLVKSRPVEVAGIVLATAAFICVLISRKRPV